MVVVVDELVVLSNGKKAPVGDCTKIWCSGGVFSAGVVDDSRLVVLLLTARSTATCFAAARAMAAAPFAAALTRRVHEDNVNDDDKQNSLGSISHSR